MNILIVSGFLGAGKTTFIKELIRQSGKYIVLLENEYGQNDLDAQEIERTASRDLKLLEFMEGCVCCTQWDRFSNTILTISAGIDPDFLVVEPTGVAKLSSLLAAIQKVSYEKIRLLPPVVILSLESYEENMTAFGDICRDQLLHAGIIVLSKCEHSDPRLIRQVRNKILAINPHAQILMEHYSHKTKDWWVSLLLPTENAASAIPANPNPGLPASDFSACPDRVYSPRESDFSQISLKQARIFRPAELVQILEDTLRGRFGLIPRAKGTIQIGQEWFRFSLADRRYEIETIEDSDKLKTQLVFIGKNLHKDLLCDCLHSYEDVLSIWRNPDRGGGAGIDVNRKKIY